MQESHVNNNNKLANHRWEIQREIEKE